ncbi:MAG: hypothetical protein ACI4TX_02305 [Christensenellales bacterium]
MVYIIIAVAVVLLGVVCYFAFKKNGKFASYKIEDKEEEKEQTSTLQLNEESENGLTIEDELFSNENSEPVINVNNSNDLDELFNDEDFSNYNFKNDSDYDYDDYFDFDEKFGFKEDEKRSEIVAEIHKMSPKMKAIVLADVLDRKYF